MTIEEPVNESKCPDCGQVTITKHWQAVRFCANCGVEFDSTTADRDDHVAVGLTLTPDEVDQLVDGEEVTITRAVSDDQQLTVQLIKELL